MKILVVGDVHVCKNSSIVNSRGRKYTQRLDNCIASVNWVERTAEEQACDCIVYLGDFFDKSGLDQDTITAIRDIEWSDIQKYFIVGNHESEDADLFCSSTKAIEGPNRTVINEPTAIGEMTFIPYITEIDRKPFAEYVKNKNSIVFAHNDIAGIYYGPVISKVGFDIAEIEANCKLFIDGHLHNGQWISNKVRTLGNLTGQNFGEDARKYKHLVTVIDTEVNTCTDLINPHALNFYQIEINNQADLDKFYVLLPNSVISAKCKESLLPALKEKLELQKSDIVASKVIPFREPGESATEEDISALTVDHLSKFVQCCQEKIANSAILDEELAIICK